VNNIDFERALEAFAQEDIPEALGDLVYVISLQALSGLVLKTPVDTGRARANWLVTVGTTTFAETDATDKPGSATISSGTVAISSVRKDPFTIVYLQNNLPYIEDLEGGSSTQAPAGMIVATVAEIESQFK
jgi:hypothetical protein